MSPVRLGVNPAVPLKFQPGALRMTFLLHGLFDYNNIRHPVASTPQMQEFGYLPRALPLCDTAPSRLPAISQDGSYHATWASAGVTIYK
jgi:hypothetical protein